MLFSEALQIQKGVTAVIGSGGKSTLLRVLAGELQSQGAVLLCTTTRMYPAESVFTLYSPGEEDLRAALNAFGVVCAGALVEAGKLAEPELPFEKLCELADFVLVEADGSKRLPLKAHGPHEPVVPEEAGQTICVVGLTGLGRPIREAAHRSPRYAELAETEEDTLVTPALAAKVLRAENLADRCFLNQADDAAGQALGRELQSALNMPAVVGSLWKGIVLC